MEKGSRNHYSDIKESNPQHHTMGNNPSRSYHTKGNYRSAARSNSRDRIIKNMSEGISSKQSDSPKMINIEEDVFHCEIPQHVSHIRDKKSLGMKSYSQHNLVAAVKKSHYDDKTDNPFKNLNAAVNELNGSSIKPKLIHDKDQHPDSKTTLIENMKVAISHRMRRDSGSLMKKDLKEDTMEINEEDFGRATANFDVSNTEEAHPHDPKNKKEFDVFYMSVNEELVQSNLSKGTNEKTKELNGKLKDLTSSKKPQSSRKPAIPRDYKNDSRHDRINSNRMRRPYVQMKKKTHQLSINLRKGSPMKAEVDLMTSHHKSNDPSRSIITIQDISKQASIEQERENIHPLPYKDEIQIIDQNHSAHKMEVLSTQNTPILQPNSRLSSSSNANSVMNIKSDVSGAKSHSKQNPSTRYDNNFDESYDCIKDMESIPTGRDEKVVVISHCNSPIFDDSDEASAAKGSQKAEIVVQEKSKEETTHKKQERYGRSLSSRVPSVSSHIPQTQNLPQKNSLHSFSNNDSDSKVDEETFEKYCNILSQKTFESKQNSRAEKSFMNTLSENEYTKEASRTLANPLQTDKIIRTRGLSSTRNRSIYQKPTFKEPSSKQKY